MRLIDADLLLENIVHLNNVYVQGRMAYIIDNQPTAYSVEAVVAELEAREKSYRTASKKKSMEFPQKMYYTGIMRGYEYSREVVRNGGKE